MQWRKLFDRNQLFPIFLDKLRVRDYVAERAPEVRCAKLYWHGDDLDQMPIDRMPMPCVIKPNNRSGAVIFVRTSDDLDRRKILVQCESWLSSSPHGERYAEWGYSQVPSEVLIEEFLSDGKDLAPPTQYAFYVFSGRVEFISVSTNMSMPSGHTHDVYSRDWERLPIKKWTYRRQLSKRGEFRPRPENLKGMIDAAERLGSQVDHVRVDLYDIHGTPYLGEMTLYTSGGFFTWVHDSTEFKKFPPRNSDDEFGSKWELPIVETNLLRRGLLE